MEKRKDKRVPVTDPVSFQGKSGAGEGIIFNLSVNGCALDSSKTVAPDDTIELDLRIPSQQVPVKVRRAKVTWQAGNGMGLEFLNMDKTAKARLQQYVDDLSQGESGKDK